MDRELSEIRSFVFLKLWVAFSENKILRVSQTVGRELSENKILRVSQTVGRVYRKEDPSCFSNCGWRLSEIRAFVFLKLWVACYRK